jgi:hypothetical protein
MDHPVASSSNNYLYEYKLSIGDIEKIYCSLTKRYFCIRFDQRDKRNQRDFMRRDKRDSGHEKVCPAPTSP